MNTGQTMLAIGAMVLLGYTVLTTNRTNLQHGVILQQTEIGVYMISLAVSRIEEASGKSFDETTSGDIVSSTASLSVFPFLQDHAGTDSAEVYPYFDDFDDYHNFSDTTYVPGVDSLIVRSVVRYVDPANPDSSLPAILKSFHKKMDVTVTGKSVSDTLRMSYVFSYWSFR